MLVVVDFDIKFILADSMSKFYGVDVGYACHLDFFLLSATS
jgi:hypothetical protein